jgi:hypothetical protein
MYVCKRKTTGRREEGFDCGSAQGSADIFLITANTALTLNPNLGFTRTILRFVVVGGAQRAYNVSLSDPLPPRPPSITYSPQTPFLAICRRPVMWESLLALGCSSSSRLR